MTPQELVDSYYLIYRQVLTKEEVEIYILSLEKYVSRGYNTEYTHTMVCATIRQTRLLQQIDRAWTATLFGGRCQRLKVLLLLSGIAYAGAKSQAGHLLGSRWLRG